MYFLYPSFYNLCTRFLKKPCSTKAPQIIEPRSATITTIITINKNIYPSSIISTEISIVVNQRNIIQYQEENTDEKNLFFSLSSPFPTTNPRRLKNSIFIAWRKSRGAFPVDRRFPEVYCDRCT